MWTNLKQCSLIEVLKKYHLEMSTLNKTLAIALMASAPIIGSAQIQDVDAVFGPSFFSNFFEYDFIGETLSLAGPSYITEESEIAFQVYEEGTDNSKLPIFKGFEVIENTKRIFLKWNTFNDANARQIIIQRSRDGYLWKNLKEIVPKGDYDELASYNFIDHEPLVGTSFYRVKMTDLGGGMIVSELKDIKVENKGFIRCFPNPSTGAVSFYIDSTEETFGILEVINSQGLIVHNEAITIHEGVVALKREFRNLKPGMYLIKLNFNSGLSFTQQQIFHQ